MLHSVSFSFSFWQWTWSPGNTILEAISFRHLERRDTSNATPKCLNTFSESKFLGIVSPSRSINTSELRSHEDIRKLKHMLASFEHRLGVQSSCQDFLVKVRQKCEGFPTGRSLIVTRNLFDNNNGLDDKWYEAKKFVLDWLQNENGRDLPFRTSHFALLKKASLTAIQRSRK